RVSVADSVRIPTMGAGAARSAIPDAWEVPPTATGISITRRWKGTIIPLLYSSSRFNPTIRTGSSTRETSPTNRRGIQISEADLQLTTRISDQLALRNNHSLCSMLTIGG